MPDGEAQTDNAKFAGIEAGQEKVKHADTGSKGGLFFDDFGVCVNEFARVLLSALNG